MRKEMIFWAVTLLAIQCLTGCIRPWGGGEPEGTPAVAVEKAPVLSSAEGERPAPPYRQTTDAFFTSLDSILRLAKMSLQESVEDPEPGPFPSDSKVRITTGPLQIQGPPPPLITRKTPSKPSGREDWKTAHQARPEDLFASAFYLYHEMDYEKGREAFRSFMDRFPNSRLTDQAQYWIGECYYAQHLYQEAGEEYRRVLTRFNSSDKFADAFFKTGLCYHRLNANHKSKEYWERLIQRYPDSRAAGLARRFMRKSAV